MGRKIIDPNVTYAGVQAESLLALHTDLGLLGKLPPEERNQWEAAAATQRSAVAA